MITKRSISKPNSKRRVWRNRDKQRETPCFPCSRPLSSSQTATRHTFRHAPNGRRPPRMGIEPHHNPRLWGGGPGTQKHTHTTPGRDRPIQANDLFHTSIHTIRHDCHAIVWHTLSKKHWTEFSVERR